MVRAAHHPKVKGTGLVRKYGPQIIKRGDEISTQLAYQLAEYGRKAIPNALKKAWRVALESLNEYQLGKYRMEGREVKTVDVVNLVHPKRTVAIDKLVKGTLKTSGKTWESIISEKGSSEASWKEAIDVMGHMALLRNLRNFSQKGVKPELFLDKLKEGVGWGKQLPFRYYSAYKAIQKDATPQVMDAVEECLTLSLGNLPHFDGRVISLCDNSGSAHGAFTSDAGTMSVAGIANLTGIITGSVADEGYVGVFGDRLDTFPIRKKSSIFDMAKDADRRGGKVGGGTENGIWVFWKQAIQKKEHWDHVFVYSDMQAGHGGLYGVDGTNYANYIWGSPKGRLGSTYGRGNQYIDVPKLIAEYRSKVNSKVMVYLIQVAGYQDTIVPEFFDRTFILGGWGPGLLRFAHSMGQMYQQAPEPVMAQ